MCLFASASVAPLTNLADLFACLVAGALSDAASFFLSDAALEFGL
jgi:hypothetical protein